MTRTHQFYGQFDTPVDQFIYERYYSASKNPGVFIECGAFDGLTECSCKFFEETLGWKGYNIEPLPWLYDTLCQNRPESINCNYALSTHSNKARFQAVDHPEFGLNCTNGSLNHCESHKKILKQMKVSFKEVEVQCITWSRFIEEQNIQHIDLMVLDIEGHELEVLKTLNRTMVLPDLFCIEVGHLGLDAIKSEMSRLGYCYDTSKDVNAYFIKKDKRIKYFFRKLLASCKKTFGRSN
jgi:FkbM family methyltransferase